jgi:hypothetical protein
MKESVPSLDARLLGKIRSLNARLASASLGDILLGFVGLVHGRKELGQR